MVRVRRVKRVAQYDPLSKLDENIKKVKKAYRKHTGNIGVY